LPLQSFRTDTWDWPESDDPAAEGMNRGQMNMMKQEAAGRCEFRKMEEAKQAVEILKQRALLGGNKGLTTNEQPEADQEPGKN